MTEHPILFSGAMIRKILSGEKTQTRRVVTPQPEGARCGIVTSDGYGLFFAGLMPESRSIGEPVRCRYGQAGDRLWVRETWCINFGTRIYRADYEHDSFEYGAKGWKPSIHMPRRFSRITLELTQVRVERVQDISLDDMRAEGVQPDHEASLLWREALQQNFRTLWDSINAKRGYSWESNSVVLGSSV